MKKKWSRRPALEKLLDNILFLEEVFAERANEEMPDLLFLEVAKSFELKPVGWATQSLNRAKK